MPPPGYEPFLATLLDAPHADAPRLVYADWLEEQGDPRAEFIRIQCELARLADGHPNIDRLADRESKLLRMHGDDWRVELPEWARKDCEFERGFVHHVSIWTRWQPHFGEHLSQTAPIERLTLQEIRGTAADFAAGPDVRHLRALAVLDPRMEYDDLKRLMRSAPVTEPLRELQFMGIRLGDTGAHEISLARGLRGLRRLELVRCGLGHPGIYRLTESEYLTNLTWLDLSDNDLEDDCIELLGRAPSLQPLARLCLNHNRIRLTGVRLLTESPYLTNLTHLELDDNPVSDRAVPLLTEHFPNLQHLRIGRRTLTGSGITALQRAYGSRVRFGAGGDG